jgi:outer membrane protein assembly factor BamB
MNRSALGLLFVLVCFFGTSGRAADWPTYRADPARSGYTAERLPESLTLSWTYRAKQAPRPAWLSSNRIQFDLAFQPIVMGDLVLLGSSADDKVAALDLATGRGRWTFFAEGPVRFAPVGWRDRVFVASDDGYLYAIALADGALLWKHRGGPDQRQALGNERLISHWPARGGPVVVEDTVYYAAGIWPSDGVYLHALDAETGKVRWTNSDSGSIFMPQPHPTAEAKSGVSPQGYLLASSTQLFVPTGRAVPAAFDRASGKFLYYRLQENQQRGGTWAMLADRFLLNASCLFEQETGLQAGAYPRGAWAASGDRVIQAAGDVVAAYRWNEIERRDRKGAMIRFRGLEKQDETPIGPLAREVIVAGEEAVCGQTEAVSVVDLAAQKVRWSHPVQGAALGLAVASGRLIVSTDQGNLYCFGAGTGQAVENPPPATPGAASADEKIDYAKAADEILARSGVTHGFCVDLGGGSGRLAEELAKRSQLQIYVVETDPAKVAAARQRLDAQGLYGTRVTVHQADPAKVVYPRYFANLIVSSRSLEGGPSPSEAFVFRLQRPYGGVACFGPVGQMAAQVRGPLDETGQWTHQNADAANTICSTDRLVKGPLKMLWYRDVDFEVANRHGQGPAPLASQGYLIVEGVDGVCALDAYNGRTLWTYWIEGVLKDYDGVHHDVAVGETGSNICLSDDSVYVAVADRCLRLDLATGRKLGQFFTPAADGARHRAWGYIAYADGLVFGSIANQDHAVSARYRNSKLRTESVLVFAVDAKTGQLQWRYQPKDSVRHNAIAVSSGRLYLIDRPIALADRITEPKPGGMKRSRLAPGEQPDGVLVALDAATGKELWRQPDDIFGTQLAVSPKHNVVLMFYQALRHDFFRLPSEVGGRMAALDAASGRRLWDRAVTHKTRPWINGDVIYAEGGAWKVTTGEEVPFTFRRSYGCGQIAASTNLMLFRSATLGYWDLTRDAGLENFGGTRPGCWVNAIPAGGLVLMPDAVAKCVCSYQIHAWMALEPPEGP